LSSVLGYQIAQRSSFQIWNHGIFFRSYTKLWSITFGEDTCIASRHFLELSSVLGYLIAQRNSFRIWNHKNSIQKLYIAVIYHIWGGELYSIKRHFIIVICFRFPYCSKKFIPNLKSWKFYSAVIHSWDLSHMGRELYSIKRLFRIVIWFRFPYCSKKFIPNLKSWKFYSEEIYSCDLFYMGMKIV
jgi:hypothetical protein